jgi:hypothetical protein
MAASIKPTNGLLIVPSSLTELPLPPRLRTDADNGPLPRILRRFLAPACGARVARSIFRDHQTPALPHGKGFGEICSVPGRKS